MARRGKKPSPSNASYWDRRNKRNPYSSAYRHFGSNYLPMPYWHNYWQTRAIHGDPYAWRQRKPFIDRIPRRLAMMSFLDNYRYYKNKHYYSKFNDPNY